MTDRPVLRVDQDIGLLSNIRMGVEVAVGLAYLSNRRLAFPNKRMPGAPVSSITGARRGRPATVRDLFDLPIEMVDPLEWDDAALSAIEEFDIGAIGDTVIVVDDVDPCDPMLREFANGRTRMMVPPSSDADVLYLRGDWLSFYSYCFFATGHQRRALWAFIQGVRPRRPYAALGARIARDLSGRFNAVHFRRSDLSIGLRAYAGVSGA
ncbi:MAG: hypothetical protein GY925_07450, partial [Actinomycetia bacterium]|nr:hypothetical protein [Actinomycetes bacterium]